MAALFAASFAVLFDVRMPPYRRTSPGGQK
jgi:hypothetical protein